MVCDIEGIIDGCSEGIADGDVVGNTEGVIDGRSEGIADGDAVGNTEGVIDCDEGVFAG